MSFAARALDKTTEDLLALSVEQLAGLPSVGKSIAGKIDEIRKTGTTQELTELLSRTPEGLLEMLQIKGIGPKKVRAIWQELGITDNHELLLACENGEVAKLKGFGDKIQATIKESILYAQSNTGKLRMEKGEELAQILFDELEKQFEQVEIVGDVRRKNEVVELRAILFRKHNRKSMVLLSWNKTKKRLPLLHGEDVFKRKKYP
jgi:DNA polymerase (family 10)